MGSDKLFWFIPFIIDIGYPNGDGLTWPVNELADEFNDHDINSKNKYLDKSKSTSTFNTNKNNNFVSNSTAYESNNNVIMKNLGKNIFNDNNSKNIEMMERNESK